MKSLKSVCYLVFLILLIACDQYNTDKKCEKPELYMYNAKSGNCENCYGKVGYNELNLDQIRITKNAECVNLSNQILVYLLDTSLIENFHELGQNAIRGYNFKGSKFDSAELFFNDIYEAQLEGADLSLLGYGYARVWGSIDEYTTLPEEGDCLTIKSDSINCSQ